MKTIISFLILVISILACNPQLATAKDLGTIKGRVMDSEKRPIADVEIRCVREKKFGESTNEENVSYSFGAESDHVTKI